jgi:hypothetical protein
VHGDPLEPHVRPVLVGRYYRRCEERARQDSNLQPLDP